MTIPTPYVETQALLALLDNNSDECDRILSDMYPKELWELENAAWSLYQRASAKRLQAEAEKAKINKKQGTAADASEK